MPIRRTYTPVTALGRLATEAGQSALRREDQAFQRQQQLAEQQFQFSQLLSEQNFRQNQALQEDRLEQQQAQFDAQQELQFKELQAREHQAVRDRQEAQKRFEEELAFRQEQFGFQQEVQEQDFDFRRMALEQSGRQLQFDIDKANQLGLKEAEELKRIQDSRQKALSDIDAAEEARLISAEQAFRARFAATTGANPSQVLGALLTEQGLSVSEKLNLSRFERTLQQDAEKEAEKARKPLDKRATTRIEEQVDDFTTRLKKGKKFYESGQAIDKPSVMMEYGALYNQMGANSFTPAQRKQLREAFLAEVKSKAVAKKLSGRKDLPDAFELFALEEQLGSPDVGLTNRFRKTLQTGRTQPITNRTDATSNAISPADLAQISKAIAEQAGNN